MATAKPKVAHKHFRLDPRKLKRAQKVLSAKTETETIEKALDAVLDEHERDRIAREAHEAFVKSKVKILDVFGKMGKN
jgi:hypothetical protein